MLLDQVGAIESIKSQLNIINNIINKITKKLLINNDAKIIYSGAGTSGRIAVQDGTELYPTFGWPRERVAFLIAGGLASILGSKENAEDDDKSPKYFLEDINANQDDVLIALAASGNTPFTKGSILAAKEKGIYTISISNNPNGAINSLSDDLILLQTGPEMVVGSTRLKAGTSQKICLNLITTMIMVKLGKVKNGQMIEMVASNGVLIPNSFVTLF
jgi:N-acetylmuramic acid 6-phosphate etherase